MIEYQLGLSSEPINNNPSKVFNSVGMIRGEYLCRNIGKYFTNEYCRQYIKEYIKNILNIFESGEVWYRTSEFSSDEINILEGCDYFLVEKQSLFGNRGIRRSILYPEVFDLELSIISGLSNIYSNLNILFPFINNDKQIKFCTSKMKEHNFNNQFGTMIEIPSAYYYIDQFIDLGITNITIGLNDLTTFLFGVKRGSIEHNINHKIVYSFIENVVKKVNGRVNISVAGYLNKEFINNAENLGIQKLIIHYSDLNELLNIPLTNLPFYNHLKQIKDSDRQKIKSSYH